MKKVHIISLGCDKNRVDTENLLFYLLKAGYEITYEPRQAEIIIINTCAFIKSAEKESIDEIFSAAKFREYALKKLVVTGCLTERYGDKLRELLPEVDVFFGSGDYGRLVTALDGETVFCNDHSDKPTSSRVLSTPQHYAYLKISDGCDNFCTYCTIPSIRGKYRSRTIDGLIEECRLLESYGVRELILVGQDVTKYGVDLYGAPSLVRLLKSLLNNTSIEVFRLMYCYPELVDEELITLISTERRIAKYIDIPLQHISSSVLKRMGRKSTKEGIEKLFAKLNSSGIIVRTTFMVGFPGESEEDFNDLMGFVREYRPLHAGIFAFSPENGTPAAKMSGQIPVKTKKHRVKCLGELIKRNAEEFNAGFVGKTIEVVYEGIDFERNLFVGRAEWDAPEIDGLVYFKGVFCDVGNVYKVKVTGYEGYDLYGEIEQ